MNVLELYLSPLSNGRMKIIAHSYGETDGETEFVLPFEGSSSRKATILKALNADTFDPNDFDGPNEQEWMVQSELLGRDGRGFHQEMRENIGKKFYEALFPPDSQSKTSLQSMRRYTARFSRNKQLLIQLEIDSKNARIFDYPWELLHDGDNFLVKQGINISRHIDYGDASPKFPPLTQINILLASSTAFDEANGMQKLPTDENQAITEWMQKFEQDQDRPIFLEQLKPVTFKAFSDYLLEHHGVDTPHIIHFDGHGCFGILCNNSLADGKVCRTFHFNVTTTQCRACGASLQGPQGYLLFENEVGEADYVSAEDIGWRIGEANRSNTKKQGILLVVLSACKSSLALVENSVFNGVAQSLIHQQIPAVIGMSFSVTASSATGFAERFYRALAQRHPLALATNWGRSRMGEIAENQWYRPALYLRWRDNQGGRIFAVGSRKPRAGKQTREEQFSSQEKQPRRNTGQLRVISSNPSTTADAGTKPSQGVLAKVFAYQEEMRTEQGQLIRITRLFGSDDIWPDECERAIRSMRNLSKPAQKLCTLLDELEPSQLTETIIKLRYALMTGLNNSGRLLAELISDITAFSEVCQASTRDALLRKERIQEKLAALNNQIDEVGFRVSNLRL